MNEDKISQISVRDFLAGLAKIKETSGTELHKKVAAESFHSTHREVRWLLEVDDVHDDCSIYCFPVTSGFFGLSASWSDSVMARCSTNQRVLLASLKKGDRIFVTGKPYLYEGYQEPSESTHGGYYEQIYLHDGSVERA